MSKGHRRRPTQVGKEEHVLRWEYAEGLMTREEFDQRYERLKREGKIVRGGRVIR